MIKTFAFEREREKWQEATDSEDGESPLFLQFQCCRAEEEGEGHQGGCADNHINNHSRTVRQTPIALLAFCPIECSHSLGEESDAESDFRKRENKQTAEAKQQQSQASIQRKRVQSDN